MARRKFKDKFTGILNKDNQNPSVSVISSWSPSSSSQEGMYYHARLHSDGYYKTEDDNYATINGYCETTPNFRTVEELKSYMDEKGIKIGSMITTTVPINDWEHKPYDRVVSLPITKIEIYAEYKTNYTTRTKLEEIEENKTDTNPKFDGDFEELEKNLRRNQLQAMYSSAKFKTVKSSEGNVKTINMDVKELFSVFKAFGLAKE